jgi:kynureninase
MVFVLVIHQFINVLLFQQVWRYINTLFSCLQCYKNNFDLIFSLKIFEEVGIEKIRSKSIILTQYLQYLIQSQLEGR